MFLAELRQSLALWRRRHAWRQRRLDIAHLRNDAAAIAHWHELLAQAGRMIRLREHQIAALTSGPRDKIVAVAKQAKANYDRNPGAYHYKADGGLPNTIVLKPTPWNWRSDCSQFVAGVYKAAGVPCPGTGTYLYSNTNTISMGGKLVSTPRPGDCGLYGSGRGRTHHIELYVGDGRFIGHGTAAVDSRTPGQPSFFLSFLP